MDDDELYDEFGNLIGDPLDSDAESDSDLEARNGGVDSDEKQEDEQDEHDDFKMDIDETALVQRNDKSNSSMSRTFQPEVETIIAQPYGEGVDEPVLQPKREKKVKIDLTSKLEAGEEQNVLSSTSDSLPEVIYSREYMLQTMKLPERVRNLAIVGSLHSGKTTFIDNLVLDTHAPSIQQGLKLKNFKPLRFMDNHSLETARGMSIKDSVITLLLPDLKDRSYVFNIIDSPGHTNFWDETTAALQAADGVLLVVDALEGLTPRAKEIITETIRNNLPITLMLNKIDRLILELRMPPSEFYNKVKYTLDHINSFIDESEYSTTYSWTKRLSPALNNVLFASASQRFCFSLKSFSEFYYANNDLSHIHVDDFSKLLWGDIFYKSESKKFSKSSESGHLPRTFTHFILEPLYKLFTYSLTTDTTGKQLSSILWDHFGVTLHKSSYKQDSQILREVLSSVFKGSKGFVDVITNTCCAPNAAIEYKLPNPRILNKLNDQIVAQVVKLTESADASKFFAYVRVYQGTLKVGSQIRVLGKDFEIDEDDSKVETIDAIYIPGGRYNVSVTEVGPGAIVILGGIDSIVTKSATLCSVGQPRNELTIFKQPDFGEKSVLKVSVEPENPSDLPKLLEGLRKVNKSYLAIVIKVEESGEHILLAPGELYLDCALHDLRNFFTDDLDIKLSDPITKFSETCINTSVTKIPVKAPSKKNQISIIAEPMDPNVGHAIESGKLDLSQPIKTTSKILRKEFGWDALSARSVWSFGPQDSQLPSLLLDDSLEGETDKESLYSIKDIINTGFKLGINEGPLCDEPIRNTKFKILDAVLSGSSLSNSGSQIIPMTRNAVHTAMLTATPRLLEPVYKIDVTCKSIAIPAVYKLLRKRRGEVVSKWPIPGTPLFQVEGFVPVIDSIGLEPDLRIQTQGQAMCSFSFDRWALVPGDPLNKDCYLPSLKPAPQESLARDFVMKTRKRKGLSGEPNLQKYIDVDLYDKLRDNGVI